MKINYRDIKNASEMTPVYNEQITGIPYCYNVSTEEFDKGFSYQKFDRDWYREDISLEKLIVCEEDGKISGFSDVAIADTIIDGKKEQKGFIRFFTYKPGNRHVGQAILEESERYLKSFYISQIKVFRIHYTNDHCGYNFYHLGYSLVSDKLGHIRALFGMNGYEISGGEIFMNQPDYIITEPALPDKHIKVTISERTGNAYLPGVIVTAFRDGKEIGLCESASAGEHSKAHEAQDWVFITGLWIVNEMQGKGLGRYLLARNLWEARKLGYKNTVISTDWKNFRALLFYTNYGYSVVDTCYEFSKSLIVPASSDL